MEHGPTPASLTPWLEATVGDCPCGRPHRITLRHVVLGDDVLEETVDLLPPATALASPLLLLADPDTYDAAGRQVARLLRQAGHRVEEVITGRVPHADARTLEGLRLALSCAPARVVAVGSGTLNDLGKVLAGEAGVPLVTVATAASMNGYTSPIASLTVDGLKVTRPAPPAEALVVDTRVLAAAPPRLNRAGFGDLLSRPVSGADWVLSHALLGEPLCPTALSVADQAVTRARSRAGAIAHQEPGALADLAEALLLSGLSMALADASSPASGGEHLFSHYLDMSATGWGRESFLHGEQVAVGTLVSLDLYAGIREGGPPSPDAPIPPEEDDGALARLHQHLEPAALGSLLAEAGAKRRREPGRIERRRTLVKRWEEIDRLLDEQLASSAGIVEDLRRAGTPATLAAIDLTPERARDLILRARHLRNRYTVLDLAADLGRLEELAGRAVAHLAR
jgi:glycerol-1-phosphate dehydrogenase [NAD(P)+]